MGADQVKYEMELQAGDILTYHGSYAEWEVIETGVTPGRDLPDGYQEQDWHWVSLKRADGTWPDFINRISISGIHRSYRSA